MKKSPIRPATRPTTTISSKSRIAKVAPTKPRWNSREKTFNNPTTIKLTNALNATLGHNSSIIQSSPLQATRNSSTLGKPPSGIQPLISPLKPSNLMNKNHSTPTMRQSPVTSTVDSIPIGKENNSSPFDLSPIKIRPSFLNMNQ